jgi:hypothetical protein
VLRLKEKSAAWVSLRGRTSRGGGVVFLAHRYAFELRDPSWHTDSVYKLLAKFKAAYCIFDLAGFQQPMP